MADREPRGEKNKEALEADMRERALSELEERINGMRKTSDSGTWHPIEYAAYKPAGGVTLSDGILFDLFEKSVEYFKNSIRQANYVEVEEWWITILQNSNEGRILGGLANTLRWKYVPEFETELEALLCRIRARQIANGGGYALSYPESALAGNLGEEDDNLYDERRNYDRAMFVNGLVDAGNYYHDKGVAVTDNLAYTILRDFMDWYNYNDRKYGEHMLEGFLGLQGHPASTRPYFTPVGRTEDMMYAELCYVQEWWMEYLTAEIPEAIYKYPLDRPHCYLTTCIDSYLDHYRATGDAKYLNACIGYWNLFHRHFMHAGGAAAICEGGVYPPDSRYLDTVHHTGELCGTAFWVDFNYKLLQLFPAEEKYAREIEEGLYNIFRASQNKHCRIRYHLHYSSRVDGADYIRNCCCEVNGANLLARVPEFLYLLEKDGVRINLYEESALDVTVDGRRFALTQEADILTGDTSTIHVTGDAMRLTLRVPSWAKSFSVKVNGKPKKLDIPAGGGYVTFGVATDDVIEVTAEKELIAIGYDGLTQVEGRTRRAFMYGPILMAIIADAKSSYDVKTMIHGRNFQGPELAIDTDMPLDNFMSKLRPIGDGRWAYEAGDGETPFLLLPYGELDESMFFSTYPLFC